MSKLHDLILTKLQEERQVVTIITVNGFQLRGRITAFDQSIVVVEIRDEQQIIYKHAVSTVVPDQPVDIGGKDE